MVGSSMGWRMPGEGSTKGGSAMWWMMMSLLFLVSVFMQLKVCTVSVSKMGLSGLQRYFLRNTCIQQPIILSSSHIHKHLNMQAQQNQPNYKADKVYYLSHQELSGNHLGQAIINLLRTVFFVVLLPINIHFLETKDTLLIVCLAIGMAFSLLGFVVYLRAYIGLFRDIDLYLGIAQVTNHAVIDEPATDTRSIEACTSQNIFVAQGGLREEDVDEEGKKIHMRVTRNMIMEIFRASYSGLRCWLLIFDLGSVASMILTIVTLASVDLPVVDKVLLSLYVVLVALTELFLVFILVLIALSPIICIVGCIYFCCCHKPDGQGQYLDLQSRPVTPQDILNAGGDCSICYQNITQKDKVYDLPCSEKHVFHHYCLRQWSKVKNTCPICRSPLPMASQPRDSTQVRERISSLSDREGQEQVHNADN